MAPHPTNLPSAAPSTTSRQPEEVTTTVNRVTTARTTTNMPTTSSNQYTTLQPASYATTTAKAPTTTTDTSNNICTKKRCGQYGICVEGFGCKCDDLFDGDLCNKCLVPGHYFPKCNETAKPIDKPVNSNRAKVTYAWGLLGKQSGASADFDEKAVRAVYDDNFYLADPKVYMTILNTCNKLRSRPDIVQAKSEHCFMVDFEKWLEGKGLKLPINGEKSFIKYLVEFIKSPSGSKFSEDVGFDNPKLPRKVRFAAVSYLSLLRPYESGFRCLSSYEKFRNIQKDLNSNENGHLGKVLLISELWPRMFTEVIAVFGTFFGIGLTALLGLFSIWMFTGTLKGAFFSICSLLGALCVILAGFHFLQWEIGIVEAISISILLGSSIDYPAHVLEAYVSTPEELNRNQRDDSEVRHGRAVARTLQAIEHIGPSLINASATTVFSVIALLFCTIGVFTKVGEILVLSSSVSIIYALVPLTSMLSLNGPEFQQRNCLGTLRVVAAICVVVGTCLLLYVVLKSVYGNSGSLTFFDVLFGS